MQKLSPEIPFGVMFHHFYSENHPRGQGAISADELEAMINWLENNFTILSPDEFMHGFERNRLKGGQICLTFDDSLLCQFDVALPVLMSKNLTAFFNVYSSAFSGNPDPLEIFRYFRTIAFESIEEFYSKFFEHLDNAEPKIYREGTIAFQNQANYLEKFPFYTQEDKKFRFFRDRVLGKDAYNFHMQELIRISNFDVSSIPEKVFMSTKQLINLRDAGHKIGLHSDTHPTDMASLTSFDQELEYSTNSNFLESHVGIKSDSMAHPCGSYNLNTIEILRELEIKIGFGSSMNANKWGSEFEIPREDHMTIHGLVQNK
jgi:peptidoglycan/xylan/chitin deacetylase (PgdA/CDA1 family)